MSKGRVTGFGSDADIFLSPDNEVIVVTEPYSHPIFYRFPSNPVNMLDKVEVWEPPATTNAEEAEANWQKRLELVKTLTPLTPGTSKWREALRDWFLYQAKINGLTPHDLVTQELLIDLKVKMKKEMRSEILSEREFEEGFERERREREEQEFRKDLLRAAREPKRYVGINIDLPGRHSR